MPCYRDSLGWADYWYATIDHNRDTITVSNENMGLFCYRKFWKNTKNTDFSSFSSEKSCKNTLFFIIKTENH